MLETLFLNHRHYSQGIILFCEAVPSKGYFGYCGKKLPTWNREMCYLTLLPIHASLSDAGLTQRKTTFACCGEDTDLRSKAESRMVWVVDSPQRSGSPVELKILSIFPVLSHLGSVGYQGGK